MGHSKAVLRRKFLAINTYIKKEKTPNKQPHVTHHETRGSQNTLSPHLAEGRNGKGWTRNKGIVFIPCHAAFPVYEY